MTGADENATPETKTITPRPAAPPCIEDAETGAAIERVPSLELKWCSLGGDIPSNSREAVDARLCRSLRSTGSRDDSARLTQKLAVGHILWGMSRLKLSHPTRTVSTRLSLAPRDCRNCRCRKPMHQVNQSAVACAPGLWSLVPRAPSVQADRGRLAAINPNSPPWVRPMHV